MTTFDLIQRTQQHLGEQTSFYTDDEIVVNGLNPAMRLLVLARPQLLRQRATVTITADLPFYDLREVQPRIRRMRRVVLGTITGDDPVRTVNTGELRDLTPTTVMKLGSKHSWFADKGPVEHYWVWGTHWLGLYKRPLTDVTITLVYDALPTAMNVDLPNVEPAVMAAYHPVIADIAAGLLTVKEGTPEAERGLARVQAALGLQGA